jgi:cytochrome b6-f complex iron-sulfur subunit
MKKKKSSIKQKIEKKKESTKERTYQPAESRRTFLKKVWASLGVLAGIEFVAVIFGFLFSGKGNKNLYVPKQMVEAGYVNSFQPNSVTPFRGGRFYLTRLEDGGFIANSLRCTHLGCSIEWEDEKKRF